MFAWRDNYISYNGAGGAANDPYWTSVGALLNFESSTTNIVDTSGNNNRLIADSSTSGPYPNYRSPYASSGASGYFAGTSYIYKTTAFTQAGTSNWTAECWFYPTIGLASNQDLFVINGGTGDDYGQIRISYTNTGALYLLCASSVSGWINTSTTAAATIAINSWYHIAAVRNGSVFTLYVNGVSKLTYSSSASLYASFAGVSSIGAAASALGGRPITGHLSDFRYVLGTAVYTAAFTPPTSPLTAITNTQVLLPFFNIGSSKNLSNLWYDLSQNFTPVTVSGNPLWSGISPFTNAYPGSIKFNGSTQYLTLGSNTGFAYATGDFTIECWVRVNSVGTLQYIIDQRASATPTSITPTIYLETTGILYYYVNGAIRITGTTTLIANTWYAVSICRNSGSTRLFVNGVQEGSTYSDSNNYITTTMRLGANASTTGNYLNGNLASVRVSKGIAYYTGTYTPSTIPLAATAAYTSLLITGSSGAAYDLSTTNSGGAVFGAGGTTPTNYKFGTQSLLSGATTSNFAYVSVNDDVRIQLGTGDFTIEGWIYRNSLGTAQGVAVRGSSTTGWRIRVNASNQLVFSTASTDVKTSTTTIPATAWTYFAWTRTGTTNYMFINGTQEGATWTDATNLNTGATTMSVGLDSVTTAYINYVDDFRVTKGVCRYTATFTAPTSAFPTS
jgi:hypothetical protein